MATERTVLVRLKAQVNDFVRGMGEAGAAVNALRKEINTTNDRTAWLTQGILAIAPAIVPLGAAAVPVFAGIAAQATVAGVAAGTVALAFNGIGDALKAVDNYKLDPTVENLTKMQQALDKVGPDGAQFVKFLDDLEPALRQLQLDARGGMFPGLEDGITALLTRLPQVRDIVRQVSEGLGQLGAEAGHSLSGHEWDDFFNFLETDAKPILIELGHTVGNLAEGLSALFVDLLPEAKGFTSGMEDASKAFNDWAHSLNGTEGFQKFLDYVDQSGPQAIAFIESLGKALIALVEAGAPVGSHLLPLFTELLDALSAIASTPLGSTLLAMASLVSLYGRLVAIGSNLTTGGFTRGISAQVSAIKTGLPTYREFGNTLLHSMHSVDQLNTYFGKNAEKAIQSRQAVTEWGRSIAPLAGQAALLGVIMTGTDQKFGAANTASLALAGSLAGPVGIAIGATVGAFLDWRSSVDAATAAINNLQEAANSLDLSQQAQQIQNAMGAYHEATNPNSVGNIVGQVDSWLTGSQTSADRLHQSILAALQAQATTRTALSSLYTGLGGVGSDRNQFGQSQVLSINQLQQAATRAQPAMQALGISTNDLLDAAKAGNGTLQGLISQIVAWTKHSDTAAGRTQAVGTALHGLDTEMTSTQQSAQALNQAMSALFGPKLGANAAHNAWLESLRALHTQLDANSKAVLGNSNAALKNQDAIRGVVNNSLAYLNAMAANGASSAKVTAAYHSQRAALIATATQLGINKGAMVELLRQYGLTPKALNTLIKLNGTDEALGQIKVLQHYLSQIDREIDVHINVTRNSNATLADISGNNDRNSRTKHARGGSVWGPGGPTDDMIPALLSNGEFVVNAYAAARNRGLLESMNAQHFATGGRAGDDSKHYDEVMRGLKHSIDLLTAAVDKDRQQRDSIRQAQQQQAQTVRDNFRNQFLDVTGDSVWAHASSPFGILKTDIRNARAYTAALRDLDKRGISEKFSREIDTLGAARQADALSNRGLHRLEHLFNVRDHASAAAGDLSGRIGFQKSFDVANQRLHAIEQELKVHTRHEKHMEHEHRKNAEHAGKAMGDALNKKSGDAMRKRRPGTHG